MQKTLWHRFAFIISFSVCIFISGQSFALQSLDKTPTIFGYPTKSTKVKKAFAANVNKYGPGHRGVDFESKVGTAVYTIAAGQVVFSGQVAGRLFVTIDHGSNIKSTYSYLATKIVKVGELVKKGQLLGTVGVPGDNDDANSFHFSMRVNDLYVDPMLYISGKIPVREIMLTPIKTNDKSILQKLLEAETNFIKAGFDIFGETIDSGLDLISDFSGWVLEKGIDGYNFLKESAVDAYNEYIILQNQMADLINKYGEYVLKGFKALAEGTLNEIKALSKLLTAATKKVFSALGKAKDFIVVIIKKGASISVGLGEIYYNIFKYEFGLLFTLGKSAFEILYETGKAAKNATINALDDYFDIDWDAISQWMRTPVYCISGHCSSPIKIACDLSADPNKVFSKNEGYKGSGNPVFIVAGLNSEGGPDPKKDQHPADIDYKKLGYNDNDTQYFSYAGSNEKYSGTDTYQDVNISVERMDKQMKEFAKKHPGEKIDILAHSLGGSVSALWLANHYDPKDKSYPELGKIIMYAPALKGTQLADIAKEFDSSALGTGIHKGLTYIPMVKDLVPPPGSPVLKQLEENGEISQTLEDSAVGKKYEIYALRLGDDLIVTPGTGTLDGVHEVVLEDSNNLGGTVKNPFTAHSNIVDSANAMSQSQRILSGKKIACPGILNSADYVVDSVTVHALENVAAKTGGIIGEASSFGQ